ncbi:hypothetical protein [Amycolatopsis sp. NPDC059657]|uniref:hypothetical protein n=1 Tax=Amycolatopsis sp. NPDC059657 TaxID=3346899 RepID=UPI0036707FD6
MTGVPSTGQAYPHGQILELWHPSWTPNRLRLRLVREAVWPLPCAAVIAGIGLVMFGIHTRNDVIACLDVFAGFIATLAGAMHITLSLVMFFDGDDLPPALTRVPGQHLYRLEDFASLPEPAAALAEGLLVTVHRLDASGADWLDPSLLRAGQLAAWDALACLDRTRTLRHASEARISGATWEIAVIDNRIGRILRSLQHSAELAEAWQAKLAHHESGSLASAEHSAAEMTEGVFAYVTAARDVLDAGPFAWEHPASHSGTLSVFLRRAQARVLAGERHVE